MSRDAGAQVYETVMAALRRAGVRPRSLLESSTPESSLSIVAAGLAASVETNSEVDTARDAGDGVVWKRLARFDLELAIVGAWDTSRVTPPLLLLIDLLTDKPWLSGESKAVLDTGRTARSTPEVKARRSCSSRVCPATGRSSTRSRRNSRPTTPSSRTTAARTTQSPPRPAGRRPRSRSSRRRCCTPRARVRFGAHLRLQRRRDHRARTRAHAA
jgi:LysR substrate binding domain-containing protein